MKKLFLIFLLILFPITFLRSWIGSDACARLIYPKSCYYEPWIDGNLRETPLTWQPYITTGGVYGIVSNTKQDVDKYQIILHDLTAVETCLIHEENEWNRSSYTLLSKGQLLKKGRFYAKHDYMLELKVWDINGDVFSDTAIFQPIRREK